MLRAHSGIPFIATTVLVALAVRVVAVASLHFDGLYGQDAFAYYYHGVALWHDHSLPYHWPWLPHPIRLFWPYGEPAQLALAFSMVGSAGTAPALAVSLLAGVGAVAVLYLLALDAAAALLSAPMARLAATLAALLLALSGLAVQASCTIMSDAPALFWGSLAVWLWRGAGRWDRIDAGTYGSRWPRRRALAAGACLGVALATRYEYIALVASLGLAWWAHPAGRRPRLVPLLAGVLVVILPQLVIAAGNPTPLLDHQWVLGWRPFNAWHAAFATPEGLLRYSDNAGTFYLAKPLLSTQSLPPPLAPCAVIGVLALLRAATRGGPGASQARIALARLAGWWLVPALYLSGVPFESSRYTLILLPPVAILEALGAAIILRWIRARCHTLAGSPDRQHSSTVAECKGAAARPLNAWRELSPGTPQGSLVCHRGTHRSGSAVAGPRPPRSTAVAGPVAPTGRMLPLLATLWIGGSLALLAGQSRMPLQTLAAGKAADLAAVRQAVALAPPGAHVATFGLTLTLYHYGNLRQRRLSLVDLSAESAMELRSLLGKPLLVVVDRPNLATQWAGRAPDLAFLYLAAHEKLRSLGTTGQYTILRFTPQERRP